jgi:hypothetical protein
MTKHKLTDAIAETDQERGETGKIEEVKDRFDLYFKALQVTSC